MARITAAQREQIKGAMGGWVYRSAHSVVSVGPTDAHGRFVATVMFQVDPRSNEERNTPAEMAKRRAKSARG